ncbi:hypothetical protein [Cardinium endosymbiont of Bemisia tabaci]|uniref:hypothetical protein n=1 Tax=Candidatus Cardinium TaxID=273135 RepID=UPI000442D192|nr:hypothetical protein [Cardinium endosymbiont of Bemisia tabaci]CDG49336.1 Hypothetical protein CHV_a0003 [Cardinium endosymbiont cBtQ1 of Bemisia tabaci]
MKPITYSKKIVLILAWYGIMVLNGTACFKSVEKKYWSVNSKADPITKEANGISEKEITPNNFLADAIEKDNPIYPYSDDKIVDQTSEEENVIDQCENSTYCKLQPSNLPMENDPIVSIIVTDDIVRTDSTDKEEWAEQMEDLIKEKSQKQTLQNEQIQQD